MPQIRLVMMIVALSLLLAGPVAVSAETPDCCRANVQELAAKLNSDDYAQRWEVLKKLALYGAEAASAVPALIKHLSNKEDLPRTIHTLGAIGPSAKAAVPDLVLALNGSLNDTDEHSSQRSVSINIITALALIREQRELIVPVLRKALDHPSVLIRYEAAHALGEMGQAGKPALPDLRKLFADDRRVPLYNFPHGATVGAAAQEAVAKIGSGKI